MSELKQKYEKLIVDQRELQRQFQEQAQTLFKETTAEFFDLNPGIAAVKWQQIIPYFNDGDPCEFSVHQPAFTNATGDDLADVTFYGDYDGDNPDVWVTDDMQFTFSSDSKWRVETREKILASGSEINIESCSLFSKMIQSTEFEPIMENMFGSHARITVTRDGFDVEEYFGHD